MPSIHVADWTKRLLDEVKEREDHASYDSVIKSWAKEVGAHKPPQRHSESGSTDIELGRQSVSNLPVNVDPFTLSTSYNVVRAGNIGSGKSVSTKVNLYQLQDRYPDLTTVVADRFDSFNGFVQALDGNRVVIDDETGLNPLEIHPVHEDYTNGSDPFARKISDVMLFLESFFEQRDIDIADDRGVLERAIKEAYHEKGIGNDPDTFDRESPTLTDVIRILRQISENPGEFSFSGSGREVDALTESANSLLVALRPFMDGGPFHNFAQATEVSIEPGELTYLDIDSHSNQVDRHALVLQALEMVTYERASSIAGKVVVAIDDGHFLAEQSGGAQMLSQHFRHSRHYDLSIQIVTQTVEWFIDTDELNSVIDTAGVLMFHKLREITDEAAKELDMTESEAKFVRNADSGKNAGNGYAEALIRVDGADWQPIRTQPTRTEIKIADFDPEHDDPDELPV